MAFWMASNEPAANELLQRSPFALLLGMMLDQQVTMEKAFAGPYELARRLGHEPDAAELAEYDPDALAAVFSERPALHRFPGAMAKRAQQLCQYLVEHYDGAAAKVWTGVDSGPELLKRLARLPGFGEQKARIFLALLAKQFDVRPAGWQEAAGHYGQEGVHRSVADVTDEDSLLKVRAYKQQAKAAAKAR